MLAHPELELVALGSDSLAGLPASALDLRLNGHLPAFVSNDEAVASGAELLLSCLGAEQAALLEPPPDTVVVDLSGGHRLDPALYPAWYGFEHPRPETLEDWRYALPELWPPTGPLIANPGCYATAALLALAPLVDAIEPEGVVVDAKSGVSGAGRALKEASHAGFVLENLTPYRVGSHQHAPEIAQALGFPVCFVPHLLPVRRGLLTTCYAQAVETDLRERLEDVYAGRTDRPRPARRRRARARSRPRHRHGRAGPLRGPGHRPGNRRLRPRQPRQGGRRTGDPEREPRTRARGDRRTAPRRRAGMSVTAALGFVASGVHCGIRKEKPDLALVRSLPPATGAAMFTVNRVQAAPVVVSKEHLALAEPQAIALNSGVANAATGQRGELDARATAGEAARLLDLYSEQVLVLSTGVIGAQLPLARVLPGLGAAASALSPEGGADAAAAIMTTDTRPKQALAGGPGFAVGGMAKGSGMIHPNLATMLAVVTTDYPLEPGEALDFLHPAVAESFNAISVDGECSTNDTVVLLANGASGAERDDEAFAAALGAVCSDLAAQIVADGEGVTFVAEVEVTGAASEAEAKAIAGRIATSPLVKTALHGRDANWGRILAAAGSAAYNGGYARLEPARTTLALNGVPVFAGGAPGQAEGALEGGRCLIELDLGLGTGRASYLTSDLSHEYVSINADYRS